MSNNAQPKTTILYQNEEIEIYSEGGLSKLEIFAKDAPNIIPAWFNHTPESAIPELPDWQTLSIEEHRQECQAWLQDGIADLPEELKWFGDKYNKAVKDRELWVREDEKQRYFQWRTYYAITMLAELEKQQP